MSPCRLGSRPDFPSPPPVHSRESYQWFKDGQPLAGATQERYNINAATPVDGASYSVLVSNSQSSAASTGATLIVNPATPVALETDSPADGTFVQGTSVSVPVRIRSGSSPFAYQWFKAGIVVPGATTNEMRFAAVTLEDAGRYSVVVTNPAGPVTSREATVTITPATPVNILEHPRPVIAHGGESAGFHVPVQGSEPIRYQWLRNDGRFPARRPQAIRFPPSPLRTLRPIRSSSRMPPAPSPAGAQPSW